jgi:hypothetical protein
MVLTLFFGDLVDVASDSQPGERVEFQGHGLAT